jgi:8-oxo-dGTP pyrophosphatase MutT (NUDIX family)
MESTLTNARDKTTIDLSNLMQAAVLIPFAIPMSDDANEPHLRLRGREQALLPIPLSTKLVLTVRTLTVEHHKGQISFPGGRVEPTDTSLEHTALRETEEEIGLQSSRIEVVGEMPDFPTVASGFKIKPFIGLVRDLGTHELRLKSNEVEKILFVPLYHLLDTSNSQLETFERNGLRYQIRAFHYEGHRIWGATGFMIQTLLEKYLIQGE